ncbi:hypothetical protein QBC45DRAFT_340583 [Copromyces sp. CBS 386.78]|nr:hypothetical protein QBC45DRAFT_340583 [Copromyces sp. CBS 386.78]
MRASTSSNLFTSLAILLSSLTLVYAIPPPELLEPIGNPTHRILQPRSAILNGTDTNGTDTNPASTPHIAKTGSWTAGCVQIDNFGTGKPASVRAIKEGVKYLRRRTGTPYIPAYACGQVSCSYNSAIFLCNEETEYGLVLNEYGDIAAGAQAVLDRCNSWKGGSHVMGKAVTGVKGQQWSVLVTGGKC